MMAASEGWYTLEEIEEGLGLFPDRHTLLYQRGHENVFVTDTKDAWPRPGWHLAGGVNLATVAAKIEWCDLRL